MPGIEPIYDDWPWNPLNPLSWRHQQQRRRQRHTRHERGIAWHTRDPGSRRTAWIQSTASTQLCSANLPSSGCFCAEWDVVACPPALYTPAHREGASHSWVKYSSSSSGDGTDSSPPPPPVLYSDGGHDECVPHAWVMDGCQRGRACNTKIENSSVTECVYNADDCDHHRLQFNSCCYFWSGSSMMLNRIPVTASRMERRWEMKSPHDGALN